MLAVCCRVGAFCAGGLERDMTKRGWAVRKAVDADAENLTECMHSAYQIYNSRLGRTTLPPMTVDYLEEIRKFPVWVAESEGRLVGGLILMPEDDCMTVANVAVHPQFQGNGLGRGLLAFAEEEARRQGYSELHLATHVLLTENLSLYSHLGWVETGRDDFRIYMKKRIK